MTAMNEIDDVFINLEMSIKLWHSIEAGIIKKEQIDNDVPLIIADDKMKNNLVIPANILHTDNDFVLWSQNGIMLSFGSAAITLWEAVKFKGIFDENILGQKLNLTSENEKISGLSYMIRCCFAHGMTRPTWTIRNQRYKFCINKWNKIIDTTQLDGKPFSYYQIGGYETLWFIKDYLKINNII
jgi:hypothetical protein